ncbi:FAD-binding domain-containing protein [Xylariaceae sp. FL0594]|nr:FAD-binding domain-containing protein [Xylariaceae sp. FL0594]
MTGAGFATAQLHDREGGSSNADTKKEEEEIGGGDDNNNDRDASREEDKEKIILLRQDTAADETEEFHEAVWGGVFNRRREKGRVPLPCAVVRPRCVTDVLGAVELARSLDPGSGSGSEIERKKIRRIAIRSGGHSWAAWSVRADAVMLDLKGLGLTLGMDVDDGRGGEGAGNIYMVFDEKTKVVKVAPAVTGEELNVFLAAVDADGEGVGGGRMFAGGHCPDVGLGGFLLQGGMGWNCKNWGWACESIVGVDVVTADGRVIHCSEDENEDLFWAARGAGPGFPAIVTAFHLQTRPLLKMYSSAYLFKAQEWRTALQWVIDVAPTADPDTEVVCVAKRLGPNEEVELIAGFLTFKPCKSLAEAGMSAAHHSRPHHACQVLAFCEETDFANEYRRQREEQPEGFRYCSDNAYISNDADDVPGVLEKAFTTLPSKRSFALYFAMNPTSRRQQGRAEMAHSLQSDHYFAVYSIWDDYGDDDDNNSKGEEEESRCTDWVRDVMGDVERHSVGSYLGDADFRRRPDTRFWGRKEGERLREVRRKWDPEGRICGYLDAHDSSGVYGLSNEFGWVGKEGGGK